jgi:hypothetical protein
MDQRLLNLKMFPSRQLRQTETAATLVSCGIRVDSVEFG